MDSMDSIRSLIPKSYHFDGYNEISCPNAREKPLFSDNVIQMGVHYLTTRIVSNQEMTLEFETVCSNGAILFEPYHLKLEDLVLKLKDAVQNDTDFITFEIIPKTAGLSKCNNCSSKNEDCIQVKKFLNGNNKPRSILAAVSFHLSEVKTALSSYYGITSKNLKNNNGGKVIMKNGKKMFGMNFELGMSKDPNIAATLMGVAVKNPKNGVWYSFDSARNTIKNLANFKMGDFPIMLLPTKTPAVGDLLKMDGEYYYVKAINADVVTLIGAADGVIRDKLPEESIIPGMTLYTKVVAFDTQTLMSNGKEDISGNLMAAVCMMQWAKDDNAEFSMDSLNDDSFNGLGTFLPLMMASGNGGVNGMFSAEKLPMLIAMGAMGGDSNDSFAQMMVLSQLLGNNADPSSMLSGIIPGVTGGSATTGEDVVCTKCGAKYATGTNFCCKCGGKTEAIVAVPKAKVICEKCGIKYDEGTNFCPKCGGKTKEISTKCSKCGADLMDGAMFCHKCGEKAVAQNCPKCGRTVTSDQVFCPGCGTNVRETATTVNIESPEPPKAPATEEPKKE